MLFRNSEFALGRVAWEAEARLSLCFRLRRLRVASPRLW